MRPLDEVWADIRALERPSFPPMPTPRGLADWRTAIEAWRSERPEGDARYAALLAELDEVEAARRAETTREEATRRWAESVGLPARTLKAALEAREEAPLALAREWLASPHPWLVLLGGTGTGKSTAAAWALLRCREVGQSCLWAPSSALAQRAGGFDGAPYADRCKGADVLVLDDFGTEHLTDWARSVVTDVLLHRHEAGARTVVTSNLAGEAFRTRLGARLADRVRSACKAREFSGPSLRVGGAP